MTLRDETEWVELVDNGFNTLVGADPSLISKTIKNTSACVPNAGFYGDGNSGLKVLCLLLAH